jgi:hypothetical protein
MFADDVDRLFVSVRSPRKAECRISPSLVHSVNFTSPTSFGMSHVVSFWDVASISDAPLVATHSNAHGVSPHSRNLTDRQLAAIRESEGLVGVTFATSYLRSDGDHEADTTADLILKHVDHLLKYVGEDGIGFGSDFDGAKMPAGLGSAAELQTIVRLLRSRGFGEPLIEKLCFKNWLRVLRRTWGPARGRHHKEQRPTTKRSGAMEGGRRRS